MNRTQWVNLQVSMSEEAVLKVTVEPLHDYEPMGMQWIHIAGGNDTVILCLTPDQSDQLEQELERGRWHRVFLAQQQREARKETLSVVEKPIDPETDAAEHPPQAESRTGAE